MNYKPNKTEALVKLMGAGSKEAMRKLAIGDGGVIRIGGEEVGNGSTDFSLLVCSWYGHMGVVSTADDGLNKEAKLRLGSAFGAYTSIRARVVENPRLEVDTKKELLQSLVYSRFFSCACLWHCETPGFLRTISHAYIIPVQAALGMKSVDDEGRLKEHGKRLTDIQVLTAAEMPTAMGLARMARMRHWCRIVSLAPITLLRLLLATFDERGTWMFEVAADMHFAWRNDMDIVRVLPDPALEIVFWLAAMREGPCRVVKELANLGTATHKNS